MKRQPLNIKDYTKNAAKNFTYGRLFIYLAISLALTILLILSIVKSKYTGKALLFSSLALIMIAAYTILNIVALIKKIKNDQ